MSGAAPHRQLGPYRLERRIAIGGMAEIYAARRQDCEEGVVVKLLLPQLATDAELVTMFLDEGRLARSLRHPNLVRVFELGQHGDEAYLVMEHVEGVALAKLLKRAEPLPLEVAVHLTDRLLTALGYLHDHRDTQGQPLEIIHRDVTPGNVLLSLAGEVKLSDFGIAKHRLRSFKTRSGVVKGTLQYMAPEQLTGGEVDRRTDLYGVGLILFEMITGRPFLRGEREVDLMHVALDPPWTPPTLARPGLPAAFDTLLRPALRRFPEQRYPNADSFRLALHELTRALRLDLSQARTALSEQVRQASEEARSATRDALQQVAKASGTGEPVAAADGATLPAFGSPPAATAARPLPQEAGRRTQRVHEGTAPILPAPADTRPRWRGPAALLGALLALGLVAALGWPAASVWLTHDEETLPDAAPRPGLLAAAGDLAPATPPAPAQDPPEPAADAAERVTMADAGADRERSGRLAARPARTPRNHRAPGANARPPATLTPPEPAATPVDTRSAPSTTDTLAAQSTDISRALSQALAALQQQGLVPEDLAPALQQQLRALRRALKQHEPAATAHWEQLRPQLAAVELTPALVEAKLKRVDQLLRQAKGQGRSVTALESQTTMALQELVEGRYQAANRQLNSILAALNR